MKKTIVVYSLYGFFCILLLLMGRMTGMGAKEYVLFILPILLIMSILPMAIDLVGGACLVIAWLPFSKGIAQFEMGIVTLNPYVVGMIGLSLIAITRITLSNTKYVFTRIDMLITLLAGIYLLSTLFSEDIVGSGYLAFHAIFVPFISYFVCKSFLKTEEDVNKAIIFFVFSITIFSLIAIFQFITTGQRVSLLGMPFIGVATLTTTGFLLILGTRKWKKPVWFFAAITSLLGLVVSFSRMYLVVIFLAPKMIKWVKEGKGKILISIVLASTLVGTLLIAIDPSPFKPTHFDRDLERTVERLTTLDFWKGSIYGRALSYNSGLVSFLESPLIGHGLKKGDRNITVHNFPVEWLEYSGLIGYLLWVTFFYQHFRRMNSIAREDKYIATGLLTIVIILINSSTNGFMHGVMPTVTFIIIGINEAMLQAKKSNLNNNSNLNNRDINIEITKPTDNILRRAKENQWTR